MARQVKRAINHRKIDAAERAKKLVVSASAVSASTANVPNSMRNLVTGLDNLQAGFEKAEKAQQRFDEKQQIKDDRAAAKEQAKLDREQAMRDGYEGKRMGSEIVSQTINEYYESNKDSGMSYEDLLKGADDLVNAELQGLDENDTIRLNAKAVTDSSIIKMGDSYIKYNKEQADIRLAENTTISISQSIDASSSPEEWAGSFQAEYDNLLLQNVQPKDANDLLVQAYIDKANATQNPEVLRSLSLVTTPNGKLLDTPRLANTVNHNITQLEAKAEASAKKDATEARRLNDVALLKKVTNGESISVPSLLDSLEKNELSTGAVTKAMAADQKRIEAEAEVRRNSELFDNNLGYMLDSDDLRAQVDARAADLNNNMSAIVDLSIKAGDIPTEVEHYLKHTPLAKGEDWERAHVMYRDYFDNPEARPVLNKAISRDRIEMFRSYDFLVTTGRFTGEEARDMIMNRDPEFNASITVKQMERLDLDVENPYMMAKAERLAKTYMNYSNGQISAEDALDMAEEDLNSTTTEYRGVAMDMAYFPFKKEKEFTPAFDLWFDNNFKEVIKDVQFPEAYANTTADDLRIKPDARTKADGKLAVVNSEFGFHTIARIHPRDLMMDYNKAQDADELDRVISRHDKLKQQQIKAHNDAYSIVKDLGALEKYLEKRKQAENDPLAYLKD